MVNIVVLMIVMVMMMSPSEVTLWIRLTKMMITRRNIGESKELAGMAIFVDIDDNLLGNIALIEHENSVFVDIDDHLLG